MCPPISDSFISCDWLFEFCFPICVYSVFRWETGPLQGWNDLCFVHRPSVPPFVRCPLAYFCKVGYSRVACFGTVDRYWLQCCWFVSVVLLIWIVGWIQNHFEWCSSRLQVSLILLLLLLVLSASFQMTSLSIVCDQLCEPVAVLRKQVVCCKCVYRCLSSSKWTSSLTFVHIYI